MLYSALVGHPVEHSISPAMFQYIAEVMNIEYAHLKIDIKSTTELKEYFNAINKIGFIGINITIPYKIEAAKYVDDLDISAQQTKTVNTIKFKNGKTIGYNTDGLAAVRAIESKLLLINEQTKILIIGAGGAARAILCEIYKKTHNVTIMNQNFDEAISMTKLGFGNLPILPLSIENYIAQITKADLIINATPVGMYHFKQERLYDKELLSQVYNIQDKCFFDAIFNPYLTKFLSDAQEYNAKICSGLYMMIYQIIIAFSLWNDNQEIDKLINVEEAKEQLLEKAYKIFER